MSQTKLDSHKRDVKMGRGGGGTRGVVAIGRKILTQVQIGIMRRRLGSKVGIPPNFLNRLETQKSLGPVSSLIVPGSEFLGGGEEAFAVRLPDGSVLRIQDAGGKPQLRIKTGNLVLQADAKFKAGRVWVEKLPFVQPASDMSPTLRKQGSDFLHSKLPKGFEFRDLTDSNFGLTKDGKWVVIDPGTMRRS